MVVVVLPTPPFWLTTASTRVGSGTAEAANNILGPSPYSATTSSAIGRDFSRRGAGCLPRLLRADARIPGLTRTDRSGYPGCKARRTTDNPGYPGLGRGRDA